MPPVRRLAVAATYAMTLCLVAASASAQEVENPQQGQGGGRGNRGGPGGGGPGGRGGFGGFGGQNADPMSLIRDPAVQAELKIDPKQLAQVEEVRTKIDKERNDAFQKMRANRGNRGNNTPQDGNADQAGGNGGGRPDFAAMREQMETMQKNGETALAKVLTAKQRKRLSEIALQVRGPMAVADPEIADKLLMDEEQRLAVKEISDNKQQAQGEIWRAGFQGFGGRGGPGGGPGGRGQGGGAPGGGGPGGDRPPVDPAVQQQRMEAMQKIQTQTQALDKEAVKAIARVLNKRQKTAFDKMMGEPFDLTKLRGRGGPGGPGRTAEQTKADTTKAEAGTAATKDQAASVTATKTAPARKGSLSARRKAAAN